MAIYKQDIVDINLEGGNIHRSFLNHTIGHMDDDADRFGVRVFRDGAAEDLSGVQCQAIFMAPDGQNIALTSYGTVDGNLAYVTLPQACYNVEGQFTLAIKLVGGGVTGTVRIVDGVVDRTGATGTVAPTGSVPTYQEILAVYAQLQEDVADYESVVAAQNGQIADLKSAINSENGVTDMTFVSGYYNNQNVGDVVNSITPSSGYVCAIAPCKPGDVVYANVYGASAARAWAYLDSDYKVIIREKSGIFINHGRIPEAPDGAAYITLNNRLGSSYLPSGYYARIGLYPADCNIVLSNNDKSISASIMKNNLLAGHKAASDTTNGITVTGNAVDGIRVSGTATANTEIRMFGDRSNFVLRGGKTYLYTARHTGNDEITPTTWGIMLRGSAPNEQTVYNMISEDGLMFSVESDAPFEPYIRVSNGHTINVTVYPELVEYSTDIMDVIKNTSDKKTSNMLDPALLSPGVTKNSVTITNNHDGTMTLDGTNTGDNVLMDVTNEYGILLEKDHTYLFSSNGNDDSIYPSNNSYRMDIRKVGEVSVESKGYEYAFGGIITPTETMLCRIFIWVLSGYTIENLTITPTLFDITDKNVGVDNSARIRAATYNVGNFANGGSGQAAGSDEIYRGLINAFQKCNADMYMFCEWDTYWNYNQGTESEVVLGRLKPYKSNWVWNRPTKWIMQMIYSDYPFVYERYGMFDDGHSRHYVDDVVLIKGKPVHFICVHLHGTDIDSRYGDYDKIKELIDRFGAEYYVIAGDFNLGYTEQGLSLQTAREEVNYMQTKTNTNSVQGGFYGALANDGFMNTYASGNDTDDVRPYDNFFVSKNIRIRNACVVESAGSDHYPLCVDLEIV